MRFSKPIILFLIGILLLCIGIMCVGYMWIYGSNVNKELTSNIIEIPDGSSFSDVLIILNENNIIKNQRSFEMVAGVMNYKKAEVPSGRFKIKPEWNNRKLISLLRSGHQDPVNVTFNNVRFTHELAGAITKPLAADSAAFLSYLDDEAKIESLGFNASTILTMFIPNTYQLYWNTNEEQLISRMKKEHDKFWATPWRKDSLAKLGLRPDEAYTLASIVEKETRLSSEKARVAGVYINRLKKGIKLEADPTVVYAVGDFNIRRVLLKHLETKSPYNTYINEGLPPGPIYMPSIETIDAVLRPEQHDFIFFCAKPGYNGAHNFAKTASQHGRNARIFHDWLNKENIRK